MGNDRKKNPKEVAAAGNVAKQEATNGKKKEAKPKAPPMRDTILAKLHAHKELENIQFNPSAFKDLKGTKQCIKTVAHDREWAPKEVHKQITPENICHHCKGVYAARDNILIQYHKQIHKDNKEMVYPISQGQLYAWARKEGILERVRKLSEEARMKISDRLKERGASEAAKTVETTEAKPASVKV